MGRPDAARLDRLEERWFARLGLTDLLALAAALATDLRAAGIQPSVGSGMVVGSPTAFRLGVTGLDPEAVGLNPWPFLRFASRSGPSVSLVVPRDRSDEVRGVAERHETAYGGALRDVQLVVSEEAMFFDALHGLDGWTLRAAMGEALANIEAAIEELQTARMPFIAGVEATGDRPLDLLGASAPPLRGVPLDSLEHVAAALALYRPGPLREGMFAAFRDRATGAVSSWGLDAFDDLLSPTAGALVWHEQVDALVGLLLEVDAFAAGNLGLVIRRMSHEGYEVLRRIQGRLMRRGMLESRAASFVERLAREARWTACRPAHFSWAASAVLSAWVHRERPELYRVGLRRLGWKLA